MEVHINNVLVFVFIGIIHLTNGKEQYICRTTSKTCNTNIKCDSSTRINITEVKYRDTVTQCIGQLFSCGWCCYGELSINSEHAGNIGELCNGQQTCNLNLWKPNTTWKMLIAYNCNVPLTTIAHSTTPTTIIYKSTNPSAKTTEITDSRSPEKDTTASTRPQVETTNLTNPQIETTDSSSPIIEPTESWSPTIETTESWSPAIETTESWSPPPIETTESWSPPIEPTESWSQPIEPTESWSPPIETTESWSLPIETTESWSLPIETTDSSSPQTETTESSSPQIDTTYFSSPQIETIDSSSPQIDTTDYSSSTADKSSPHSPEQSNGSSRIVRTKDGESADFPIGVAVAIPVGIVVMILVIVGIVCVVRRRSNGTTKSKQIEENTLPMQNMTDNNSDNPPPSGNRNVRQEAREQDYVDTTTHKDTLNITCDSVEHDYVDTNKGGINATDDDEYNTLNTHRSPVQKNPNYDYLPKGSHTTVDETYSHVTGSQTAVSDATYSHLQDSKLKSSHNAKSNQNNSNNVYNHINTLSVDDNVYNNIQTNFTRNPTSNLSQSRTEEDDYDHTDWNQAKSPNPIASSNGAIKTPDTQKLAEHADDEYAVVNKKSDQVESNDGNNYFVLEKQSF